MTCHWFRHHAGVNCIPLLTCQLHEGLITHGEHLIRRCQGWTDDMARQRVLHFRALIWDRWTQALEVTSGQRLPDQEVPLLQRRTRLSREQAIRLWKQRRAEGWTPCAPQWNPPRLLLQ